MSFEASIARSGGGESARTGHGIQIKGNSTFLPPTRERSIEGSVTLQFSHHQLSLLERYLLLLEKLLNQLTIWAPLPPPQ